MSRKGPESGRGWDVVGEGLEGWVEFCTVNDSLNTLPCILGHWSDAEAGGAPMRNNGTEPNRHPGMYKVTTVAFSTFSRNFRF